MQWHIVQGCRNGPVSPYYLIPLWYFNSLMNLCLRRCVDGTSVRAFLPWSNYSKSLLIPNLILDEYSAPPRVEAATALSVDTPILSLSACTALERLEDISKYIGLSVQLGSGYDWSYWSVVWLCDDVQRVMVWGMFCYLILYVLIFWFFVLQYSCYNWTLSLPSQNISI